MVLPLRFGQGIKPPCRLKFAQNMHRIKQCRRSIACRNRTTPEYHNVDNGVAVGRPWRLHSLCRRQGGWCCGAPYSHGVMNSRCSLILRAGNNFLKQRNHNKPPDFRILFLKLNPKYVHVFKSAIFFDTKPYVRKFVSNPSNHQRCTNQKPI